ncbi:MAG: S4 domain-containing protein [Candidatus Marsarchaeota archaeon]|nr:S4 domain-containing protein [Candidatus Marsarchaeota archaeon]
MAKKGNVRHVKSMNAPDYYGIPKKESKYVIKPAAGRHSASTSIALLLGVKKMGNAKTSREALKIIKGGLITVNGKIVKDVKYPIGFGDVIGTSDGKLAKYVSINKQGQIAFENAEGKDYQLRYKIINKYKSSNGTIRARLHDGRTLKLESAKDVKVGDSVEISKEGKIKKILHAEKGAQCFVIGGVHVGEVGKVAAITPGTMHISAAVQIEQENGTKFETLLKNLIVIG